MYIYRIKNKLNNKSYIGQSSKSIDKTKDYFGSGILIQMAIKKYGILNFEKTILCECNSREELNNMEIHYINQYNSISTGYNISKGGGGGDLGEIVNKKISETIKRIWKAGIYDTVDYSQGHPQSEESKLKISNAQKGENGYWYGKTFSVEHIEHIRINTHIAYENGAYDNLLEAMRSDEVRKKISDSLKGNVPWNKGKVNVYSDEQIQRMSESAKNRNITDENEEIRRDKISKHFLKNHPNRKNILDNRSGVIYNSLVDFCNKTKTSWYKTKKMRTDGLITIINYEN